MNSQGKSRANRKKSKKPKTDGLSRKGSHGGSHESCHSSQEGQHDQLETQAKKRKADLLCYRGLRNQGATCYLNSVLQTLFMTEEFRKAVIELKLSNGKKNCVSEALQMLFHDLESGKPGSATTYRVTNALEIRNVCEQQDAAEYYQKILSLTENKAAEIFQGEKKHSTVCKYGSHDPVEELNSFFSLAIPMDSDERLINIEQSFGALFDSMVMEGEDQLYCKTCQDKTDMEMRCTILEWPEVLTLHLQRFNLDYSYMVYRKNNCPVKIPLQLKVQDESGVDYQYDLYAVVNHSGSLSGGHYYADIKSSTDQQWYEFNDSSVHRIDSLHDNRQSKQACLLFYRKCQTEATKQDSCESNIQQDKDVVKGRKSGELSVSQTNTNIQNEMNPEHTLPQQDPDHINIENQHTDFTAKAEMNSNDDTTENQATPNIHSGAAEDNIQSTEMHHPDFSSHLIIDKQQPSQRRDSDITGSSFPEVSPSTSTASGEHEEGFRDMSHPQSNTNQMCINPEDTVYPSNQNPDGTHIYTESNYDSQSTPINKRNRPVYPKNCVSETEAKLSLSTADESTPEKQIETTNKDNLSLSTSNISFGSAVCQLSVNELNSESNTGENELIHEEDQFTAELNSETKSKPTCRDKSISAMDGQFSMKNFNNKLKPREKKENLNTKLYSKIEADMVLKDCHNDSQPKTVSQSLPEETVVLIPESVDLESHETKNKNSDSDVDEETAQKNNLLEETNDNKKQKNRHRVCGCCCC